MAYTQNVNAELGTFTNAQGLELHSYEWAAKGAAKGVVLLIHGVSSHLSFEYLKRVDFVTDSYEGATFLSEPKYDGSWVEALNEDGLVCTGFDAQGYGLSQPGPGGTPFFFEKFDDLITDLIQFRGMIQAKFPDLPIHVVGLSMGGCMAARLIEVDDFAYAGCILMAPMLSLDQIKAKPLNKVMLPLAGFMSRVAPKLRLAAKQPHPVKEMRDLFDNDPLTEGMGNVRVRVGDQCLKAIEHARDDAKLATCPMLLLHSVHDTMTDPHGSSHFAENCSSKDVTLNLLEQPHFWHILVNEPGNEEILVDVRSWLSART